MTIFASSDQCRVHWSVVHVMTSFVSTYYFWVRWPVLSLVTILSQMISFESSEHFESKDQFWVQWSFLVQWPVLSRVTSFDVDVINVCFPCINLLFLDLNKFMMIWDAIEMMLFIMTVDAILRSWDSYSYEFLESYLQEFMVFEWLAILIELYVGSWVWWTYEWWIYNIITSYGVEIGEWIYNDVWYWFEWS